MTMNYPNSKYRQIPYDLVRELTLATVGVGVAVLVLAAVFSTPDVPALSAKQVVQQDPLLLVRTELNDLSGQSELSTYGPPYNHGTQSVQAIGGFSPQAWSGVHIPIDPAQTEVIRPLERMKWLDPALNGILATWTHASESQQSTWVDNVQRVLPHAAIADGKLILPAAARGSYGPVVAITNDYLALANSGLLEAAIDGEQGSSPLINRTKSLLLFQGAVDSTYAKKLNMLGEDWGVIKETGNYPGAVWLWYYTLLYQIPPYSTSSAVDLLVVMTVMIVTGILMLTPFVPGLRSIPRFVGVYKFIWRRHYREVRSGGNQYETRQ